MQSAKPLLTHVKVRNSIVAHPSDHHVGARHAAVGREAEAHPSRRAYPDCEGDGLGRAVEAPVEAVHARPVLVLAKRGAERIGGELLRPRRARHDGDGDGKEEKDLQNLHVCRLCARPLFIFN